MIKRERDFWSTKYGLILAMAGNAVGLGNFLRFPVQAAENGGGAFLLPYIICFLIIGIPLMWIEWGIGRFGGSIGSGTVFGISNKLRAKRSIQIFSLLGVWIPFVIAIYYVYIESWTLGYSISSLVGDLQSESLNSSDKMEFFTGTFSNYIGSNNTDSFFMTPSFFAYSCFLITIFINYKILSRGIVKGIEKFVKIAMPALLIMSLFLVIYVLSIKTPISSSLVGLDFLWKPDFSYLSSPSVWIAAAGQVFFTLSLGFGAIVTYASFIRKDDDIALSGLTSASINELIEVVFGGSIVIPAAVAFLGISGAVIIASSGAFTIGFIAMPLIFDGLPFGQLIGFVWFFLLFIAGLTSSIGILQPVITFFSEEFSFTQKKSSFVVIVLILILSQFIIFFPGFLDEFDFWAGTILLIILAIVEIIIFVFYIAPDDPVASINHGSLIKVPKFFNKIFKLWLPMLLITLFLSWVFQDINSDGSIILRKSLSTYLSRLILISLFLGFLGLVYKKVFK
ncbi:MAG: sodium-dependent transporter [Thermodesulfobacteriota bacterium]